MATWARKPKVITLTDKAGDGFCCENGVCYFQVYSDDGAVTKFILEKKKIIFSNSSRYDADPEGKMD